MTVVAGAAARTAATTAARAGAARAGTGAAARGARAVTKPKAAPPQPKPEPPSAPEAPAAREPRPGPVQDFKEGWRQADASTPSWGGSRRGAGGGLLLGILLYPVLLAYLRGGPDQVKKWARAKFLNQPTGTPTS